MKKRLFILIFLFCLILAPKNVFADNRYEDIQIDSLTSNGQTYSKIEDIWYGDIALSVGNSKSWSVYFGTNVSNADELIFNMYINNKGYVATSQSKFWACVNQGSGGQGCYSQYDDFEVVSYAVNVSILGSDNASSVCSIIGSATKESVSYSCKLDNTRTYNHFHFTILYDMLNSANSGGGQNIYLRTGISSHMTKYRNNLSNNQMIQEQQTTNNKLDQNKQAIDNQTNTIKSDDTTGANSQASSFFNDFQNNNFGLSDVITMPLTFINGLSDSTCYDLDLPLPFVNKNAKLPCMTSVYQTHFGSFLTLYQVITTGLIAYWVCINIFKLVKNFKDPDNYEVEVMDL